MSRNIEFKTVITELEDWMNPKDNTFEFFIKALSTLPGQKMIRSSTGNTNISGVSLLEKVTRGSPNLIF